MDEQITTTPVRINKVGHLVYEVSDIDRTIEFWTEVMGLKVSDRNPIGMVFLHCGDDHHLIGLMPAEAKKRAGKEAGLGINHLAFEVDNVDILFKARDWLKAHDIPVTFEGRRGPGGNSCIHVLDPDGFDFELYCSMDKVNEKGEVRPEHQFHRATSLEEAVANPLPKTW